ncbi:MAG: hypothetical protein DWP97_10725 [Calditrichaeota bacterium]|nr:MAG: hypothetical protein DWP97_10725 [Calditrichota bacterium]
MGLRFENQKLCDCYFVTTTFKDWENFGNIQGVYELLAESLDFYAIKYHVKIIGYVFMPSHIHLLLIINGEYLSGFMRDFKKYISQKSIKELGIHRNHIWKPRFDRVAVYTEKVFRTKLEYIHKNPVRANLVENMESWKWSSYGEYVGKGNGIIPVYKEWNW